MPCYNVISLWAQCSDYPAIHLCLPQELGVFSHTKMIKIR